MRSSGNHSSFDTPYNILNIPFHPFHYSAFSEAFFIPFLQTILPKRPPLLFLLQLFFFEKYSRMDFCFLSEVIPSYKEEFQRITFLINRGEALIRPQGKGTGIWKRVAN